MTGDGTEKNQESQARNFFARIAGWVVTFLGLFAAGFVLNHFGVRVPWMNGSQRPSPRLQQPSQISDEFMNELMGGPEKSADRTEYELSEYDEFILNYHEQKYAEAKGRPVDFDNARTMLAGAYSLYLRGAKATEVEPMSFEDFLGDSLVDLKNKAGQLGYDLDSATSEFRVAFEGRTRR